MTGSGCHRGEIKGGWKYRWEDEVLEIVENLLSLSNAHDHWAMGMDRKEKERRECLCRSPVNL